LKKLKPIIIWLSGRPSGGVGSMLDELIQLSQMMVKTSIRLRSDCATTVRRPTGLLHCGLDK